jgi:phosphoglycolate phosphatase-like HAD superfamily hydrolase
MSLLAELRQAMYDLPFARKPGRDEVAHFCEHHGIRRRFIRVRTTWQALTPSAIKPWWMILNPMKNTMHSTDTKNKSSHNKKLVNEVLDNA